MGSDQYHRVIVRNNQGKVLLRWGSLPPLTRLTVKPSRRGKTTIERQGIFSTTRYLATHNESVEASRLNFTRLLIVVIVLAIFILGCAAFFRFTLL